MDSSDDQDGPPKKRAKREKFKGLRARINQLSADAYKSLARVEDAPFGNADSFFQERLDHWKEMDVTSNFRDLVSELAPITGSLYQVIHHKDQIFQIIANHYTLKAVASIEGIGELMAGLARDIQELFIPLLPCAVTKVAHLIDYICHNPEPLGHAVRSLSNIIQSLSKILINKIPWVLHLTKSLRTHRVPHIRKLIAQSVSYLFRHTSPKKLKVGIKCLLAECCTWQPREQTMDGVGQALARICIGIQGRLNSHAEVALATVLDSSLLCLDEFKMSGKGKRHKDADLNHSSAPSWLTMDIIRARCSEAASTAFTILLEYHKEGDGLCMIMELVVKECNTRMDRYIDAWPSKDPKVHGDDRKELRFACRELGRCVCLAAMVLEKTKRTSKINVDLLMALASRLSEVLLRGKEDAPEKCSRPIGSLDDDGVRCLADHTLELHSSLAATLQQSKLIQILEEAIPTWSRVLSFVSSSQLFNFSRKLLASDHTVLHLFGSEVLASLCRVVGQHGATPDAQEAVEALLLVCEVAQAFRLMSGIPAPRLMVGNKQIATYIVDLLKKWESLPSEPLSKWDVAMAWLSLRCLPELAINSSEITEMCRKVVHTVEAVAEQDSHRKHLNEDVEPRYLLLIQSKARRILGKTLCGSSKLEFVELVGEVAGWLQANPQEYCVLEVASDLLNMLRQEVDKGEYESGAKLLTTAALQQLLPVICPLLSSPSQNIRKAALRTVCAFEPPILKPPHESEQQAPLPRNKCNVFNLILEIEKQPMSLANEQRAQALTDTVKSWIEGRRIPDVFVHPVISSVVGMLHIRFSRLWGPVTQALGVAALKHPEVVWRLLFPAIESSQIALLDGKLKPSNEKKATSCDMMDRMEVDMNSGSVEASGDCTDPLTTISNILKSVVHAECGILRSTSSEWVDVFLELVARRPGASPWRRLRSVNYAMKPPGCCTFTEWKKCIVSWLSVIEISPEPWTYHHSVELLQSLGVLLGEDALDIQKRTLACMKNFKVPIVGQYIDRFNRLIDVKTLKDELSRFPINDDSESPIPDSHRGKIVPILTSILTPKFLRPRGRLTKGMHSWILTFLGGLRDEELKHFLGAVLQDFNRVFAAENESTASDSLRIQDVVDPEKGLLLPEPQWVKDLDKVSGSDWWGRINAHHLREIPVKTLGKAVANLATVFGELGYKLSSFLSPVLALLTHILQDLTTNKDGNSVPESSGPEKADKETRGSDYYLGEDDLEEGSVKLSSVQRQCLRLMAKLWVMLPDGWDHGLFIEKALAVVEPSMHELKNVDGSEHNQLMLLDLACAISSNAKLSAFMAPGAEGSVPTEECSRGSRQGCVLLSNVVACIASHNVSSDFHDAALTVIENILGHGEETTKAVLMPHIPNVLTTLKEYIVAVSDGKIAKDYYGNTSKIRLEANRELSLLEQTASLGVDSSSARTVTHALFPLLMSLKTNGKTVSQGIMIEKTLNGITAVWNRAGKSPDSIFSEEETSRFCSQLAPQASRLQSKEARLALTKAFSALGSIDKSIECTINLFGDLNSFTEDLSGDFDYDRRLAGYAILTSDYWKRTLPHATLPLLHTCLFDMENPNDLSIRQAASESLSRLIEASTDQSSNDQPSVMISNIYKFLLRNVGARNLSVRQEHLARVRQILVAYPSISPGLAELVNVGEEEHDFFCCVSHLQLHRRARAWVMLSKEIDTNENLPRKESMDVIVPLILQAIFDGRAAEATGKRVASEAEAGRESTVVEAAVLLLSRLASKLPWNLYKRMLNELWNSVGRANVPGKSMVKALCAVIDAFPFPLMDREQPCEAQMEKEQMEEVPAGRGEFQIAQHMLKKVLPKLKKLLMDEEDKARPSVALSLVKLLKKAPMKYEQSDLRGILQRVANALKHRWQGMRDDARTVFVGMARELGSKYLGLLIMVLQSSLPSKGFSVHVLGYTIHAVLEAVASLTEAGDADPVLKEVLPIIDAELFGEVADAKEAKQFAANYREAKTCRACDTCYLLVQNASFAVCTTEFMQFFRSRLSVCSNPNLRQRLSDLLRHFSNGVLDSKSATLEELFSFVYDTIDEGMCIEEKAIAAFEAAAGMAGPTALPLVHDHKSTISDRFEPLIVEFTLRILLSGLKKGQIDVRDVKVLGLLDPILPLLVRCLRSRHSPVSSHALKCVCLMVRLPLPGLSKTADMAGNRVMAMLDEVGSSTDPVAQDCFNFLAKILQEGTSFNPTNDQVNSLLILIQGDLEEHSHRHTGFTLFKALIDRQIMVPGIYDMMNKVQKLMVISQTTSVRQASSALLMKFLLTYPLGEMRLIDHLKFVLKNLSYEFEAGRLQVIDLLQTMMKKFPVELVEVQAEFFFLPMVVGLANDDSASCREQLAKAIECLIERVGNSSSSAMVALTMQWLASPDKKLRRTATQVMGIFAQAKPKLLNESEILQALSAILLKHSEMTDSVHSPSTAESSSCEWHEAYSALVLLEKLTKHLKMKSSFLQAVGGDNHQEVEARTWEYVFRLLKYKHLWVRKSAVRLVMQGLTVLGDNLGGDTTNLFKKFGVTKLSFLLSSALEEGAMDDELVTLSAKALVWIAPSVHDSSQLTTENDVIEDESRLDELQMAGLIAKMSKIADDRSVGKMGLRFAALKFLAALTSRLGSGAVEMYLDIIMVPLFRILESSAGLDPTEVRATAEEVQNHVKQVVGGDVMLASLNRARHGVHKKRTSRKQKDKLQRINNPEAAARRRVKKNRVRLESRKRDREFRKIAKPNKKRQKRQRE